MPDDSHLDDRYFIDENVYNCPFCNRRHVAYRVTGMTDFHWTDDKKCWVYFVRCDSCEKISMHLTFECLDTHSFTVNGFRNYRFMPSVLDAADLDSKFFYSIPTSFFVLDRRVPHILRELLSEAEGCLKSNFLTGASACARKAIYELATVARVDGDDYESRIKALKAKYPEVDPVFFDTLLTIQQVTSTKVHEEANDGWESKHLRLILSTLFEILREIFVVPEVRKEKRQAILELKRTVLSDDKAPEGTHQVGL